MFVQWVEFFNKLDGKRKQPGRQQSTPSSGPDWRSQLAYFKAFSIQHNASLKNAKSGKG